jgi:uncharacterized protein involved in exopolysaccharide biosynthesis
VISVPRAELIADAEARQKKRNEILRKLADLERELAVLRRLVRELGRRSCGLATQRCQY